MIDRLSRIPGTDRVPSERQIRLVADAVGDAASGDPEKIVALVAALVTISGGISKGNELRMHKTGNETVRGEKSFSGQLKTGRMLPGGVPYVLPDRTFIRDGAQSRPLLKKDIKEFLDAVGVTNIGRAADMLWKLYSVRTQVANFSSGIGFDPSVYSGDQVVLFAVRFISAVLGLPSDIGKDFEKLDNEIVPITQEQVDAARKRILDCAMRIIEKYESQETGGGGASDAPRWVRVFRILERFQMLKATVGDRFPPINVTPEGSVV